MYRLLLMITISLFYLNSCLSQNEETIENKVIKFSLPQQVDTIEFVVVDTILNKTKPIFLWCQGSLPVPLFCEIENYGYYFFGGGISNFDYNTITSNYHLVIISMPKTPIKGNKKNLNANYQYIPNAEKPYEFSEDYLKADYIENYVNRANTVLTYLGKQKWVSKDKLIITGHSQGSKVATKLSLNRKDVTHLGLFAANPFGRIDQYIREARLDAQFGKISWEKADSIINDNYDFFKMVNNPDSVKANPQLLPWKSFSETYYDDWLEMNIPIYLAYGTEDRTSDLCDIVPLFFLEKGKNNLTLKRYIGLEHNFFEKNQQGEVNYEKGHWMEVMDEFVKWIK